MVYEVTKPSSQRINKITTMVQSIFAPPPVASCDDPTPFVTKAHCGLFVRLISLSRLRVLQYQSSPDARPFLPLPLISRS